MNPSSLAVLAVIGPMVATVTPSIRLSNLSGGRRASKFLTVEELVKVRRSMEHSSSSVNIDLTASESQSLLCHAALDIGRVHVQAEYIRRDADRRRHGLTSYIDYGYGVQAQVDIFDNFQLTCRYDELDLDDDLDTSKDCEWYTVGYNWTSRKFYNYL